MPINKKTFCLAPWYSIFLNSRGNLAPCCSFLEPNQNYKSTKEYFNSADLNAVRKDLLSGIKNPACKRCWKDEENGKDSLRMQHNRTLALHTDLDIKEQIKKPNLSKIKSFDLTLGNLCNLKCVMCKPELSSQLLAEAELNPQLTRRYGKKENQKDFDWAKGQDFANWCNQYLPQSIHIKFTGGEPFMIPWIQKVIDEIPDEQKSKCVLHFTTNLTIVNNKLFDNFKKFKEVWISVSVEGTHETHEYMRYGHSWALLTQNIKDILSRKIGNLIFIINHVVQAPSYHSILDMTNFFDALKMKINPILATRPKHYHISALTKKAKQDLLRQTESYNGYNTEFIQFVRSVSQAHMDQDKSLTKDCIRDLELLDNVRKNSHRDIIPLENIKI